MHIVNSFVLLVVSIFIISLSPDNLLSQFSESTIINRNQTYESLSLEECLSIAEKNNFDISISNYQMQSAGAEVTNAFGNYLPSVSFNASYNRAGRDVYNPINGAYAGYYTNDSYSMSAGGRLNIFDGFRREYIYQSATNNYDASVLTKEQTIADVRLNVYKLYIAIIYNYQSIKIQQENLEQGKTELERIKALHEAGSIPIGDLYAQESDLGNKEINLINSHKQLAISKANLLNHIGFNPNMDVEFLESSLPIDIREDDIKKFNSKISAFRIQMTKALNNRADYEASQLNINSTENSVDIAKSGYYPTLSASAGWNFQNEEFQNISDFDATSFGFTFSLPIFQNFTVHNNVERAKLSHQQSIVRHERLKQTILTNLNTLFLSLDAYERQIIVSTKAVKSAEQNYNSAKSRFEIGAASITDLIQANTAYLTAKINKINSIYSYIQTQKEILHGVGELD